MSGRYVKSVFALTLAAGAVAVGTQVGALADTAHAGAQPGAAHSHGTPNAVPPILALARSSDLASLEAGGSFSLNPPAQGRYSNAEMNAHSTARR